MYPTFRTLNRVSAAHSLASETETVINLLQQGHLAVTETAFDSRRLHWSSSAPRTDSWPAMTFRKRAEAGQFHAPRDGKERSPGASERDSPHMRPRGQTVADADAISCRPASEPPDVR